MNNRLHAPRGAAASLAAHSICWLSLFAWAAASPVAAAAEGDWETGKTYPLRLTASNRAVTLSVVNASIVKRRADAPRKAWFPSKTSCLRQLPARSGLSAS